ncbi:MAG: RAMP superfamily CRISPR-associated protein, partial [Monoglobaceae bacterium]
MPDFINPYTFVPIEKKKPERMAKEKGDKSGYIECSLEIKSPTFIPNTTRVYVGERQHKEKVFYSYTNLDVKDKEVLTDELRTPKEPVIPGSEIRGMLRSVYEQLTNSCFLHIDENNLPYKRTNEPKLPAIMVYDGKSWQIYTDIKYGVDFFKGFILPMQDRSLKFTNRKPTVCENSPEATYRKYYGYGLRRIREKGHRLNAENFKFISETDENGREKTVFYSADCEFAKDGDYYIHVTPQMINKDHSNHFIMYTDKNIGNKKGRTLSVDSIIRFQYIIGVDKNGVPSDEIKGSYTNDTTNPNNDENGAIDLYKEYRQRYINHEPLFVYVDKSFAEKSLQSTAYIAPAAMSKEFFTKTIYDILENQHSHQPCDDKNKICPACRMFGMIGGNGGSKGKLRFTDTYDAENIVYYKRTNLPILATPRISSTEFYIEQ